MSEITVWGITTLIFIAMQGLILLEVTKLENKINDLEAKLDHKLTISTGQKVRDNMKTDDRCKECKKDWTKCSKCPVMMKWVMEHKASPTGAESEDAQ